MSASVMGGSHAWEGVETGVWKSVRCLWTPPVGSTGRGNNPSCLQDPDGVMHVSRWGYFEPLSPRAGGGGRRPVQLTTRADCRWRLEAIWTPSPGVGGARPALSAAPCDGHPPYGHCRGHRARGGARAGRLEGRSGQFPGAAETFSGSIWSPFPRGGRRYRQRRVMDTQCMGTAEATELAAGGAPTVGVPLRPVL